jgi:small multidrug resistance family-3 protein
MTLIKVASLFTLTAFAEIVGCYLPYLWLKEGKSTWLLIPAAISLACFAWLLSLHPGAAARTYADYGGIYIVVAILWLWLVEGQRPTRWDIIGSTVCIIGMGIIVLSRRAVVLIYDCDRQAHINGDLFDPARIGVVLSGAAGFGFAAPFLRPLRLCANQSAANRESSERADVQPSTRFHLYDFLRINEYMASMRRGEPQRFSSSINEADNIGLRLSWSSISRSLGLFDVITGIVALPRLRDQLAIVDCHSH